MPTRGPDPLAQGVGLIDIHVELGLMHTYDMFMEPHPLKVISQISMGPDPKPHEQDSPAT